MTDSFSFTPENQIKAEEILKKYPATHRQSALVPLLDLAQRQLQGWLSQPAIEAIAAFLEIPFLKAFEVASFYSLFHLKPVGKHHVQICGTTPCWLRGSDELRQACTEHLGINLQETTSDQLFTLNEVECLGACIHAPVVQINDTIYENLTPYTLVEILKNLAKEEES